MTESDLIIYQAFRLTNNNDLTSTVVAPGGITLPDVLTESDLFTNLDTSLLFPQTLDLEPASKRPGGMDFGSQLLPDSSFRRSVSQEPARLEDPSLVDLDLGEDELPLGNYSSMEVGRDAPAPRPVEEDLFSDAGKFNDGDDLELDLGDDDALDKMDLAEDGHDNLNDLLPDAPMEFGNDEDFGGGETPRAAANRFERDSESPLSDAGSDQMHQLEEEFNREVSATPDAVGAQQGQRVKRQKLMGLDKEVAISSSKIKDQQNDRSAILKPASFLPRDPVLLTLMTRQQNGDFVSSVFGEDRGRGWAPELRGMLSLDSVKKAGELKRKRDSGISDMDVAAADVPALELGEEEAIVPLDEGIALDTTINHRSEIEFPGDEGEHNLHLSDDDGMHQPMDELDDTIVHPVDTEAVSMGTKHAVHILREKLGDSATQQKKSVLFQDLLPEQRSSKADATKMFFEVLVLATKDAVQVDQGSKSIGGPLKIRGKQALWGAWAEENAAGAMSQLSQAL
jgi:cohesin complex subunit SCC1